MNVPYDKSVDLYLFGLLAYEILVGKVAFSSNDDPDVIQDKIKNSNYDKPMFLSNEARDMI